METIMNYLFNIPFDVLLIFINLVKLNLYLVLFYAIYRILLRNHTFFKLNRFYLLASLALSLILPFVAFTETVRHPMTMKLNDETAPQTAVFQDMAQMTDTGTDWGMILILVYGLVASLMCFKLFKGFYNLNRIIRKNECLKFDEYSLVLLPETETGNSGFGSFSFFRWLVVSYKDYENHLETILQHEFVHIKQWHSLDILFVETMKIIFWFNPVLWFYKSSLSEVHEFLADDRAENRDSYASFLIAYAQNSSNLNITNQFSNASLLKARIKMIYTSRTSKLSIAEYVVIVAVIGFITFKTAPRKTLYMADEQTSTVVPSSRLDASGKSHTPTQISNSAIADIENNKPKKSYSVKEERKRNKSAELKTSFNNYPSDINQTNAQDTLKNKKARYSNYPVAPIEIKELKPFFPTIASYTEEKSKFMNFSAKELPKTEVKASNFRYQKAYNGPRFEPIKFQKTTFPSKN